MSSVHSRELFVALAAAEAVFMPDSSLGVNTLHLEHPAAAAATFRAGGLRAVLRVNGEHRGNRGTLGGRRSDIPRWGTRRRPEG